METDRELSDLLERAKTETDGHCEELPHEPSREYADAYLVRAIIRAAAEKNGKGI